MNSLNDLDDLSSYARLDPEDFLASVEGLPGQFKNAIEIGMKAPLSVESSRFDSVAILGMGGSGIAGNVVRAVLDSSSPMFVRTIRGYDLPAWVDRETLVIAVSYSGNTEETLAASILAINRGCICICVSSGGALSELDGLSAWIQLPGGLQPRAALGNLAVPILVLLDRLDFWSMGTDLKETLDLIQGRAAEFGRNVILSENPAKALASRLAGKIPLIYGAEGIGSVAAYRWKCQINECSKVPAFLSAISEAHHNEIEGWGGAAETNGTFALLLLHEAGEAERAATRFEATKSLLEPRVGMVADIHGQGVSAAARIFDLMYLGDFVATYLAIARGIDPTPVKEIEKLKSQISVS